MNPLRRLAGQTAIYGLPSIVGRLLNYLLVPLHTAVFAPESFGVIVEMYAYVSFLVVLLTYGMETAYFRFFSKEHDDQPKVFSTVMFSLFSSTAIFVLVATLFAPSIASFINYPNNEEYIVWFAFIVGLDALSSIPLAKLRVENKAVQFASINFISIIVNIGLNYFWIGYCIPAYESGENNFFLNNFYTPEIGVGYVFLANLFATGIKFLLLSPQLLYVKMVFSKSLLHKLLIYGMPLLLSSLAIIINENADKIMLKWILSPKIGVEEATEVVGIYGACYKLSIIISLFIQAFRYAAEPFFFNQEKEKDSKAVYGKVMKYFVIVCVVIFLGVMLYLDIIKNFLSKEEYWAGLHIVPILLFANIFLGIFYNLSVWYKLGGKTKYAALISGMGAVITIALNFALIPYLSYVGSAWATLICYVSMVIVSYFLGQKNYKITYPVKRILFYLGLGLVIYFGTVFMSIPFGLIQFSIHSLLLVTFLVIVYILEYPKKVLIS